MEVPKCIYTIFFLFCMNMYIEKYFLKTWCILEMIYTSVLSFIVCRISFSNKELTIVAHHTCIPEILVSPLNGIHLLVKSWFVAFVTEICLEKIQMGMQEVNFKGRIYSYKKQMQEIRMYGMSK